MAIVIYTHKVGGYGDLLFALKAAQALKEKCRGAGYDEDVYVVTNAEDKQHIVKLGGDREFSDARVVDVAEFKDIRPHIRFNYYLEGPVFNPGMRGAFDIPLGTQAILVPEYDRPTVVSGIESLQRKGIDVEILATGFRENGIFITDELVEAADSKSDIGLVRDKYWTKLDKKLATQIRGDKDFKSYHENTELSFQYSHDVPYPSCENYLKVHRHYMHESKKNQDILCVGGERAKKREALEKIKNELIADGFTRIEFVDLATGKTEVLHNAESVSPSKVYRMLYETTIKHEDVISILALCSDLVGITGDQSLGEALSANKIIVYECLSHKTELAKAFVELVGIVTSNAKAKKLAEILFSNLQLFNKEGKQEDEFKLENLITDPEVKAALKAVRDYIIVHRNLANTLADKMLAYIVKVNTIQNAISEKKMLGEQKVIVGTEMKDALQRGDIKIIKYLVHNLAPDLKVVPDTKMLNQAIQSGHLELVKYFLESLKVPPNHESINAAILSPNREQIISYLLNFSIQARDTNIFSLLLQNLNGPPNDGLISKVIATENRELLNCLLLEIFRLENWDQFISLVNTGNVNPTIDMLNRCASLENPEVLLSLLEKNRELKPTEETLNLAIQAGNLMSVYALVKYFALKPTQQALEFAVGIGHLGLINYLCEDHKLTLDEKSVSQLEGGEVQDYFRGGVDVVSRARGQKEQEAKEVEGLFQEQEEKLLSAPPQPLAPVRAPAEQGGEDDKKGQVVQPDQAVAEIPAVEATPNVEAESERAEVTPAERQSPTAVARNQSSFYHVRDSKLAAKPKQAANSRLFDETERYRRKRGNDLPLTERKQVPKIADDSRLLEETKSFQAKKKTDLPQTQRKQVPKIADDSRLLEETRSFQAKKKSDLPQAERKHVAKIPTNSRLLEETESFRRKKR